MPSHKQVSATIKNCVTKIKVADGYTHDVDILNVRTGSSNILDSRPDAPKGIQALVSYHGSSYVWLPAKRCEVNASFTVTLHLSHNADDPDAPSLEEQAEDLQADFERMVSLNMQAGGISLLTLEASATDSGYAYPEAVIVFELMAKYIKS